MNTNKVIKEIIPQTVRVRSYEVDIKNLQNVLRKCKKESKLTNKQIASTLSKPVTLVEHWFRTDKCFSIPDDDIWFKLKSLLDIKTDIFDKSILTFEDKPGVFEMSERFYNIKGISPTITTGQEIKVIINE